MTVYCPRCGCQSVYPFIMKAKKRLDCMSCRLVWSEEQEVQRLRYLLPWVRETAVLDTLPDGRSAWSVLGLIARELEARRGR